jgi:transposase
MLTSSLIYFKIRDDVNVSYIQYKVIKNKKYAYEMTSHWDKEKKQSRSISKYLGPVDPDTNEILTFTKKHKGNEKLILDFGDGYFLYEWIKKSEYYNLLNTHVFEKLPGLFPLIIYRLCTQSAMYNCEDWYDGNVISRLFKNMDLSSQRISEMLSDLGDESVQRLFFIDYIKLVGGSDKSVIIDATSLPNQINIDFNAWGRSDGKIDKQFRLLCVIDQINKTPLFYRLLPGNITDVSTLQTTIVELKAMGVHNSFILMDAGYFSEANILDLYDREIDFLTRLPGGRKIYNDIVLNKSIGIESLENANIIGSRSYFVKSFEIDLYGKKAYSFVILDPERKAKETKDLLQNYCKNKSKRNESKDKFEFANCGIMVLISSKEIPADEVLSAYYLRLSVEQVFCCSKSDLGLLPIRNHNENTVRGYLFLQFLLLVIYLKIKDKIAGDYTLEQVLLTLRKLKCKLFDHQIIPAELTKKQRIIFEQAGVLVPKFLGI